MGLAIWRAIASSPCRLSPRGSAPGGMRWSSGTGWRTTLAQRTRPATDAAQYLIQNMYEFKICHEIALPNSAPYLRRGEAHSAHRRGGSCARSSALFLGRCACLHIDRWIAAGSAAWQMRNGAPPPPARRRIQFGDFARFMPRQLDLLTFAKFVPWAIPGVSMTYELRPGAAWGGDDLVAEVGSFAEVVIRTARLGDKVVARAQAA